MPTLHQVIASHIFLFGLFWLVLGVVHMPNLRPALLRQGAAAGLLAYALLPVFVTPAAFATHHPSGVDIFLTFLWLAPFIVGTVGFSITHWPTAIGSSLVL